MSLLSAFSEVKNNFSFKEDHTNIESLVFHAMKVAMGVTLVAFILVTATAYFGDNINCITGFEKQEHRAIETYCFISSTYSMINFSAAEHPYLGVGPMNGAEEDELLRHAYYQWVPMVLFIQSFVLYLPKVLWKGIFDKAKFSSVTGNLNKFMHDNAEMKNQVRASVTYMKSSINTHRVYTLQFLLCEIIAFFVALGNLFFTNAFLGGSFFLYGSNAISYIVSDPKDINNPLNEVFPKIAKCMWRKFGPSGSIQTYDALCVLPHNIVNEKTYIILWLVYIVSFIVLSLALLYHIVLLVTGSSLRKSIIIKKLKDQKLVEDFNEVAFKLNFGDWFVVHNLSSRMTGPNFQYWIKELCSELVK